MNESALPLWQCRRHHSVYHDAFISYRVNSEASFATALAPLIETVGLRRSNRSLRVFLDSKCLNDAEDWRVGFLNGLQSSKLIVYLISEASLDTLISKTTANREDNVLLEIEAGLKLAAENKARLFPIVIGSTGQDTIYQPFNGSYFSPEKYPNVIHIASGENVRSTMTQFFRIQVARVEQSPLSQSALCSTAERILHVLSPSEGPIASNQQIPSVAKSFTGRESEIDLVQQCLFLNGVSLVTGLPGMGKSSVAAKVAHNCLELYQNVFWISLESLSSANTGFEAITNMLNLPMPPQASATDFRKAISKWLSSKSGYLLVIDNADSPNIVASCFEDVPKFLGDVLITSRNNNILQHFQDLDLDLRKVVEIESWNEETTCAYLTSRTKKVADLSNKDVKSIIQLLAGHSLSVAQAASYMVSNRMSYAQFVMRMTAVINSDSTLAETGKRGSIGNIFQLFKKVCLELGTIGEAALGLLASVSYISPVAIPRILILSMLHEVNPDMEATDVLNVLLDNGWLRSDASESIFSTHAVIQELCHSLKEAVVSLPKTIHALKTLYPEDALFSITPEQKVNCRQLSVHVQHLTEFLCGLGTFEQKAIWQSFKELLYLWLRYLERLERLTDFTNILRLCLSIEITLFGVQSLEVATSKYFLGKSEFLHGNLQIAKAMEFNALEIFQEFYTTRLHLSVASALYEMGQISFLLEDYVEAQEYLLECLKIRVDIYKTKFHYSVGHTLYTLSQTYGSLGDNVKAKDLLYECLDIFETVYGTRQHTDVSFPLNDLGIIADNEGDYNTAKKLLLEALDILEQGHGTRQNRSFASSLHALGNVYIGEGNYSQARKMYLEALEITESLYSHQHPDVAGILLSLGNTATAAGDDISAEEYFLDSISTAEKVHGTRQLLDIAMALKGLGAAKYNQDNIVKAKEYYTEALEIYRALMQGPSSEVASIIRGLGMVAFTEYRYDESKELYLESLEMFTKLYGQKSHYECVYVFTLLGQVTYKQGKLDEAQKYYQNCLKMRRDLDGAQLYPNVAICLCNLAEVYAKQSLYVEARKLYSEALEIYTEASDRVNVLSTTLSLASVEFHTKDFEKAKGLYISAEALQKSLYSNQNHPSLAIILYSLGAIESILEHYDEAQSYLLESIRISEMAHGNLERASDAKTICALGWCVYKAGKKAEGKSMVIDSLRLMRSVTGTEDNPDVLEIMDTLAAMEEGEIDKAAVEKKATEIAKVEENETLEEQVHYVTKEASISKQTKNSSINKRTNIAKKKNPCVIM